MSIITKEDIQKAFQNKNRQRNLLLYRFYKEVYFHQGYTGKFIAQKISEDLGIDITLSMIEMIKHRIIKKQKNLLAALPQVPVTPQQVSQSAMDTFTPPQVIKDTQEVDIEKVQIDYDSFVPMDSDDKPYVNPFAGKFNRKKDVKKTRRKLIRIIILFLFIEF